eukprot:m.123625 g.123625  ORF g.123625 m.123625 type:complete len:59 (+) comp37825_c0_seq1:550-726(+)
MEDPDAPFEYAHVTDSIVWGVGLTGISFGDQDIFEEGKREKEVGYIDSRLAAIGLLEN